MLAISPRLLFSLLLFVLMMGCDPGMTIRQATLKDSLPISEESSFADIVVRIHEERPHIGETWYVPTLEVINTTGTPATVTSFELVTGKRTYTLAEWAGKMVPRNISNEEPVHFALCFDLGDPVYRVFQSGAALMVYHVSQGLQRVYFIPIEEVRK